MESYIGTKQIKGRPMTRAEYNTYRGWELPADEDGTEEVYLVEYPVDVNSKPNHPDHEGYITMSPKHVFDEAYKESGEMTFGHAVELLKAGHKVARSGWNGKSMWLKLVEGRFIANTPDADFKNQVGNLDICSHIDMFSADQKQVVGWLASQTDVLAEDWGVV